MSSARPPRAAVGLRQDRPRRARARAAQRSIELLSTGGTARLLAGNGVAGARSLELHRLSRDHGRARQDAASEDPRRPARPARHRRCGHGAARHRAHRPAGRQSLSVRGDGRAAGLQLRGGDREHRHRRAGDAARRGQEPRSRRGGRRSGRLRRGARGARRARVAQRRSPRARASPPRPSRTPRATTPWWPATSARRSEPADERFPATLPLVFDKVQDLRYGENPHQQAAFYREPGRTRREHRRGARVLQGKELSFNNIADADTAIECVRQFAEPACVIVKHANPCGVARRRDAARGLRARLPHRSDLRLWRHHRLQPRAGCRRPPRHHRAAVRRGARGARRSARRARALLARKPNVRVLELGDLRPTPASELEFRSVTGGLLVQTRDTRQRSAEAELQGRRRAASPTPAELADLHVRLARVQVREVQRHRVRARPHARSASAPAR